MRRSKVLRSVTMLAALLAGTGSALVAGAPAMATRPAAPAVCSTGALLVPSCGVLWGAAAGGFTDLPRDVELRKWEKLSGRTATIFHTYHNGAARFPTADEISLTSDPAHPRVLLTNWKVSYRSNWANVAAGGEDKRIDAFAVRAKAYGKKTGLAANAVTCTVTFPDGTVATVVRAPVPPGG